jgi:prefoldin subunit 5
MDEAVSDMNKNIQKSEEARQRLEEEIRKARLIGDAMLPKERT